MVIFYRNYDFPFFIVFSNLEILLLFWRVLLRCLWLFSQRGLGLDSMSGVDSVTSRRTGLV